MDGIKEYLKLARWLAGDILDTLPEEERAEFKTWLGESSVRQEELREIRDLVGQRELDNNREEIARKGWHEFAGKTLGQRRYKQVLKYAAVITLPIIVAATCLTIYRFPDKQQVQQKQIQAGGTKAILKLSDGRTYNLEHLIKKSKITEKIIADSCVLNYVSPDTLSGQALVYNKLRVPRGGTFQLALEDGTKIWLNSESELTYPEVFVGESREVYLDGEAYFDVAKDAYRPFIVHSGIQHIQVLGTTFGITNYSDIREVSTTLVSGKVQVKFPEISDEIFLLEPGCRLCYDRKDQKIRKQMVNADEYVAWKDGKYVFNGKPLEDILETLARWYDFQVFYQTHSVKERLFSGELMRFESFRDILGIIEEVSNVKFSIKQHTVIVADR